MTIVLTPEPSSSPSDPPRVGVELTAPDGGTFTSLSLKRDGVAVRRPPFVGASSSETFDYEAPFGVPVSYSVSGEYLPVTTADWSESWGSLAAWSGDTASFSVSGGKARSSVTSAAIVRSASGTIQRLDVTSPSYVRVELLTSGDVVVASVQVDSKVTVVGTSSTSVSGGGSFSATLSGGTISVAAVDSSWSLTRPYLGTPTKVRIVGLGVSYPTGFASNTTGDPYGVATDSSGNIYVTDGTNNRVRKFNSSGVEVVTGGFPISTTGTSYGVAVDSSGNIYVTDFTNSLVRKYNSSGVAGITFTTTGPSTGIAVDSGGNIYVTDGVNKLVRKFNSAGTAGITFSTTGLPYGIAVDSGGNIYVADATNNRVRKYNSAGTAGITFSTTGVPWGLGLDSAGNIYVADNSLKLMRKFTSAGASVLTFSTTGNPYGLATDSSGNIFVADDTNNRVRKFTATTPSVGAVSVTPLASPLPYTAGASTQLDETRAWLIHPSNPSLSVAIDVNQWTDTGSNVAIDTAQQTDHVQPLSIFSPPGRSRSVVYPLGPRKVGAWTLSLQVANLTARDAILSLLADGAPLLLRSPDWDWDLPDDWYAVGDVTQNRVNGSLKEPYRHLTLPLTPVDSPPVALVPEFTFGDLLLAAPTFADVLEMYPTFLDVLTGSSS